jgi:hypothetical protein
MAVDGISGPNSGIGSDSCRLAHIMARQQAAAGA